jgi:hypothetical protein
MTSYHFKESIVVCVILLFFSIGVQSSNAIMQKEITKTSTINQDETRYLANLSMDFGYYITNNRIEYESIYERPQGNYTINAKINFRCPENLMIVVRYKYIAHVYDPVDDIGYRFYEVEDTVVIKNGSNPPDINDSKTHFIHYKPNSQYLRIEIKANLTAYKFIAGEWVKSHNDDIFNEIFDKIYFNRYKAKERTLVLLKFFERFPLLSRLLHLIK